MRLTILLVILVVTLLTSCVPATTNIPTETKIPTYSMTAIAPSLTHTATRVSTSTPTPSLNIISASSPDNKFTISLEISKTPIALTIFDNSSNLTTQIPISYRYYNKILGDGPSGFQWSSDNKILMFGLYREPYPDEREEDYSVFFAINTERGKIATSNYSSIFRGLWPEDESGITLLEHGGLNDIFDYYFSGTNCFKSWFEGECESSYVSPMGKWELSQWEENADVTVTNLLGDVYEYSYANKEEKFDYLLTLVQRWTEDENYVFFSPTLGSEYFRVYGLFRMDLTSGEVVSLLGEGGTIDKPYYLTVSPQATKVVYITEDSNNFIMDLSSGTEKRFSVILGAHETLASFVWSPDETKVIFTKLRLDEEYNIISTDCLRLDTETGGLITILKDMPEFLNATKITNSDVSIGQNTYSLIDGSILK